MKNNSKSYQEQAEEIVAKHNARVKNNVKTLHNSDVSGTRNNEPDKRVVGGTA